MYSATLGGAPPAIYSFVSALEFQNGPTASHGQDSYQHRGFTGRHGSSIFTSNSLQTYHKHILPQQRILDLRIRIVTAFLDCFAELHRLMEALA
jgi:hypothetical protein